MKYIRSLSVLALFLYATSALHAQPTLEKDYSFVMNVPSVVTIASSPAHFYVLSETEGMAVFRSQADSLRWLYSSAGMQRRGNSVIADIRFAYLLGNDAQLTVLEPTSVLGVYSSTELPAPPLDVHRLGQNLYVAIGHQGIGKLSLETEAAVDAGITFVAQSQLGGNKITSLAGTPSQLFALSNGPKLFQFAVDDEKLSLTRTHDLSEDLTDLYLTDSTLYGSDSDGNIFEISGNGDLSKLGSIGEQVTNLIRWKEWLVIKGASNRLWTSYKNRSPQLWKKDGEAGNHITRSKYQLWLSEYGQIAKVNISRTPQAQDSSPSVENSTPAGSLTLGEIDDYTIPHSKPLIFPIRLAGDVSAENVQFTYQSPDIKDAEVRGQSFYWDPSSSDVGSHRVKIIASSSDGRSASTSFNIHVRSFNAPPRFTPVRPVSIPVGEPFSMPLNAIDTDGINKNLIRFLGVNLPDGATIDEATGTIEWTPQARQVGENTFRVIATDQYGAASSVDVTINVIDSAPQNAPEN
ncbi:putative Ig domain-containing protein [Fodinibius sediminis]|uniref:Ig domain-containing protein n=1 Tax=Fodinibius sediminis TaxID=1214077 RepID=A0A521C810_9BACT|nr:putative Ig domain-containing protein [Fodinibius sediminis]SMO55534.1 Putative Ig domain-containing protein [Fodinibius sediminis]